MPAEPLSRMSGNDGSMPVSEPRVVHAPQPEFRKPKIRKRAIAYAIGFDIAVSLALGFLYGIFYLFFVSSGTFVYFANLQTEIAENMLLSWSSAFFGTLVSVLAGYLAAQVGGHRPYTHAAWAGSIIAAFLLVSNYTFLTMIPTETIEVDFLRVLSILASPLMIVMYLAGAHLYILVNGNKNV